MKRVLELLKALVFNRVVLAAVAAAIGVAYGPEARALFCALVGGAC